VLRQRAGHANREPIIQICEYALGLFLPNLSARIPPHTAEVIPHITVYTENIIAI